MIKHTSYVAMIFLSLAASPLAILLVLSAHIAHVHNDYHYARVQCEGVTFTM